LGVLYDTDVMLGVSQNEVYATWTSERYMLSDGPRSC